MDVSILVKQFEYLDIEFFTGVPDSQLKSLCNYLMDNFGLSKNHIIASNEGNAVALAAGYYLSTGKVPCVYLQNSGLGNIINPIASLINDKVYAIPTMLIIGWRGEPGIKDEPQHMVQGEITLEILEVMDIEYIIIDNKTSEQELRNRMDEFKKLFDAGKSAAIVVKKGSLSYEKTSRYQNSHTMSREEIIRAITKVSKEDIIVSTTGKSSRELFEIRENNKQSHKYDFLTVGSMGHSSSIALGVALSKPNTKVWCIDGDGAVLMHMGSMALIGAKSLENYIHVIINNGAHESVGGQPTVADGINFGQIALGCGYKKAYVANDMEELEVIFSEISDKKGPILIEAKATIGSRDDLGRPTTTPAENKKVFMDYLRGRK